MPQAASPDFPAIPEIQIVATMNRSTAFCLLLGLQLSYCMSINKTSDATSTICTEEWENASPVNLCKIYNWIGGLTSIFRQTGEVVSEIEDNFFIPPEYVEGHFGYGDQVNITNRPLFLWRQLFMADSRVCWLCGQINWLCCWLCCSHHQRLKI